MTGRRCSRRDARVVAVPAVAVLLTLVAVLCGGAPAAAQDPEDADAEAVADSTDTASDDTGFSILDVARQASAGETQQLPTQADGPRSLFSQFTNKPTTGARANVRQYNYYWELDTSLMIHGDSFTNKLDWSFDDFRRQVKETEKWNNVFNYKPTSLIPAIVILSGRWNRNEDRTVNAAGIGNLNRRDNKRLELQATKANFETGPLVNIAKITGAVNKQQAVNQRQRNDFNEANLNAGVQSALEITSGLVVAGRIYGSTTSGDRALGESTSPSTAHGDSLGFGAYYGVNHTNGRATITRSNFRKQYLDFVRNSNALIDTVGRPEDEKVVGETETNDALTVELVNNFRVGRVGFKSRLSRTSSDLDFAASGVGLKQRQSDIVALSTSYAAGRDSFALAYDWNMRWDDQRYKDAVSNRGRQYVKDRDWDFSWYHRIFTATQLSLRYHQNLVQDIAENPDNENDKDRLQTDFSVKAERSWPQQFKASMVFAYSQVQDVSIRESKSANNNFKDSYEIAPSYTWNIAPWLTLDQSYRLYIQYTDYRFSSFPGVTRKDNYNKRGNLATRINWSPTPRLSLTIRNDYNKRFGATKASTDATGQSRYNRDLNQRISKIDLGMTFAAAHGVTLEAATYRTRDDKTSFGTSVRESTNYSGEIWVGAKVRHKWGRTNPLEFSAMVRKYNAFGPSITETSADYWEADVWLKWAF